MTKFLNRLAEKRTLFHLLFPLACLIFAKPQDIYLFIGAGLVLLGEIVRIISAGHITKNELLTVSGPYAYTRNPLYFGSFLMGLGISFLSGFPLIVIPIFLFLFALIYIPTIKGEEDFLEKRFGEEYLNYKNAVPVFLPSLKKRIGSKGEKFQWSKVKENNEHRSLLFSLLLISLFFLKKLLI
jgi:protein-S-isoprenylcysteine O-methyltransferase Ste14